MTELDIKAALDELQVLACTAWAEARGDGREGASSVEERLAVMCVIRNRVREPLRWGDTYRAVCLARKQFSCWNAGADSNHLAVMALAYRLVTGQPSMDPLLDETLYLADGVMSGVLLDRVKGATHYYAPKAMRPPGRVPDWAKGHPPLVAVGSQLYFRV